VEELSGAASDGGYSLSPNGRYRHSPGYVEQVLADAGLQSEIVPAELRLEAGEPVAGLVVRATTARATLCRPAPTGKPMGDR
jgi:predicted TPR repeat methyltransferase